MADGIAAYQLGEAGDTLSISQDGGVQSRRVVFGCHVRQTVDLAGSRADATIAAFLEGAAVAGVRTHWLALLRRWDMTQTAPSDQVCGQDS